MPPRKSPKRKVKAASEGIAPTVMVSDDDTISNVEKPNKPWLFKKGNNANPGGRPKGSRNKLEEAFVASLYEAFESGGSEAIKRVMLNEPAVFLNVIAKVLPKQVETKVQISIAELGDDELANIAAGGSYRAPTTQEHSTLAH